ncbi:glycogen synthase [Candidatus Wolfebacteria bacterium]|nr:glycogen synthase [Candidatus Wolfebacteria bacterium]
MKLFTRKPKFKILFVTTEEAPFVKVGGLGEVMFALPRALAALGHEVRVMLPLYGTIENPSRFPYVFQGLEIPTAPNNEGKRLICNVRKFNSTNEPSSPVTTYFLENQEYYELRANVYGYGDDRIRFALLSRGCLEFLNVSREWMPEVVVATDWMTGYLPNFLKTDYRDCAGLESIATLFSIHNLSSQGTIRPSQFLEETEHDDGYGSIPDFFGERMPFVNAMRRGIMYADIVNTVSPAYAKEITTEEFGEGLDALLREKRGKLYGVLNGIDYDTNDPATDGCLAKNYTMKTIASRVRNKLALQQRFGLPQGENIFMMGIVSRLVRQKGFALLLPILGEFLKTTGAELIVVGTGDAEIMNMFQEFEKKFSSQVRLHLQFDEVLPHQIYAGSDVVLVPSKFEPSGLTQMEAMRFGAVPVARRTGGLADTIEDYVPEESKGTGFLFDDFEPNALLIAMTRAFVSWQYRSAWLNLEKRAMEKDFSWDRSAKEYSALFESVIRAKREN